MEYINILSASETGAVEPINFNKAIMAKDNEGFVLSGSKMILSYLKDKIGNIPMLIDFSTIPSTFKNDKKLADFITIYDPSNTFIDIQEFEDAYQETYKHLQDTYLGIFYHPYFFDSPRTPTYYYSEREEVNNCQTDRKPESPISWCSISGYNKVFFKNVSFSLPYDNFKSSLKNALTKDENCNERNILLLKQYNKNFLRGTGIDDKKCCLLSIPLIGYPGRDNESHCLEGNGAIFVYFIKEKSDENDIDIKEIANDLWFLGLQITYNSIFQIAMELADKATKEAERSAKAAIMSRNLSHNLGSHVMFYIKHKLESVNNIFKEGTLEELIQERSFKELEDKLKQHQIQIKDHDEMPFLVGLGRFLNYLQERQDYIATVATNHIPYCTTINFKDSIYDELKPEKKYERHKSDADAKDRKASNLLLNYIAYSEKFVSSDKIEIKFRKDCTKIEDYDDCKYFDGSGLPDDVPDDLRKFNISLPGGNLGRQAFFSIMENIIRNTAKHESNHVEDNKLTFLLDRLQSDDIKDIFGYSWREGEDELHNSCSNLIQTYKQFNNDLHYLGITVVLDSTEDETKNTLRKIKDGLRQGYLTEDRKMDSNCKGLKEIRISAAWIRGRNIETEIPIGEPPAVAIRKTKENYLQYIVCLPKPKKVAIITTSIAQYANDKEFFRNKGCQVFSYIDICEPETHRIIAGYDLVIADKDINDDCYKKIQIKVGSRIFKWVYDGGIKEAIENKSVYLEWIRSVYKIKEGNFPIISILDAKVNGLKEKNLYDETIKSFIHVSGTGEAEESYYNNCIVFRTHYAGQPKLNSDERQLYSKVCFVEAISGGNSTDRLLRRERFDMEWYAKHVAAGMAKIAIIDERIYEMILPKHHISEREKDEIKKKVENFASTTPNANFVNKIEFIEKELQLQTDVWITGKEILSISDNSNDGFANVQKLSDVIIDYKEKGMSDYDYSLAWKYRECGIWTYNIEQVNGTIQILGYGAPIENQIGKYSQEYRAEIIATIEKENDDVKVIPKYKEQQKKFDFISIHQGILDKIYRTFDLVDIEKKRKVTKELYKFFSVSSEVEVDGETFLPQFIVHSGRSKPSSNDMPQHQPFLQFSALDNAIKDCKYTLSELLYSAHYE